MNHQTLSVGLGVQIFSRFSGIAASRYRNATLAGFPVHQCRRLQSALNAAARLIRSTPRYQHVTPLLRDLHWLRSRERISFKVGVLCIIWRRLT